MIKSDAEIYRALERVIKQAGEPQTCVDIYEKDAEVRKLVDSPNKVSNYLGHMWRRGLLQRYFAAQTSTARARYAYTWKEADEGTLTPRKLEAAKRSYLTVVPETPETPETPSKPNVTITEEDGKIVLDFAAFTITVTRK